tara:strand:+ start:497 stop:1105 length:609 start_codon:yes stop_codon:yes gene_type:complete
MESEDEKSLNNSDNEENYDTNTVNDSDDDETINSENESIENFSQNNDNIENTNFNNDSESYSESDDDDDDDDDDEEDNYKKISNINDLLIEKYHPESLSHNYDEIETLSNVVRDKNNNIIDPFHKTIPILTKYEKARILGQRSKQISNNSKIFVDVNDSIIDSYSIAEMELKQKKIPFIIKRPLPGGTCEYWRVKDLEILSF